MKIKYQDLPNAGIKIQAQADGRWDGSPANPLFTLQHRPLNLHPDRRAVAATLLFSDSFGGVVDFGAPINIVTAGAIRSYCDPVSIYPTAIDQGPKPLLNGYHKLLISPVRHLHEAPELDEDFDTRYLFLADSSQFDGSLTFHRGSLTSSNSWVFGEPDTIKRACALLAAGVLVAEEFQVKQLNIPHPTAESDYLVQKWEPRVNNLLSSVGLGMQFAGDRKVSING